MLFSFFVVNVAVSAASEYMIFTQKAQHGLNTESIHINSQKPSRDWRQELYSLLAQLYYAGGGYTILHDFSRVI